MVIKRTVNGVDLEFTLSGHELSDAYYEQEHKYDVQDVMNRLDAMDDEEFEEHGLTRAQVEELVDEIAYWKRRNMDKYDMSWSSALDEAMGGFWYEYGEEEEKER